MDFLFVIAIVVIVAIIMPKPGEEGGAKIVSGDKSCPPHKWEYQEILDARGISQGQRMVCSVCKQTPGYVGRGDE